MTHAKELLKKYFESNDLTEEEVKELTAEEKQMMEEEDKEMDEFMNKYEKKNRQNPITERFMAVTCEYPKQVARYCPNGGLELWE